MEKEILESLRRIEAYLLAICQKMEAVDFERFKYRIHPQPNFAGSEFMLPKRLTCLPIFDEDYYKKMTEILGKNNAEKSGPGHWRQVD